MGKKVLIIGSGGREHAIAWKLAQSPRIQRLYVAPGNAGTKDWNIPIPATDVSALVEFALQEKIDLTIVGPEEPLSLGVVDTFRQAGLRIFGPTQGAAQLEASKSFAKLIMEKAQVPTAQCQVFTNAEEAKSYVRIKGAPCVLKADGLAGGKGVIVALEMETALQAVDELMDGAYGDAGHKMLIEEYLEGEEVSFLCFTDGITARAMVPVQDYKRALDGDQGPNTGGMGTYGPPAFWTPELEKQVMQTIVQPTLVTMAEIGLPFHGVLFVGLMLTKDGPKVLEYNARFGDPETQVVMLRLKSDLWDILWACTGEGLSGTEPEWYSESALCVVMAAPGYPLAHSKGINLSLPSDLEDDEMIFHAGTELRDGRLISSGGRVLGVAAKGWTLAIAKDKAYALVERIGFPGAHYRRDIGGRGGVS